MGVPLVLAPPSLLGVTSYELSGDKTKALHSTGPTVWWGHRSKRVKGMTGPVLVWVSAGPTVWWGHRSKRAKGMTGPVLVRGSARPTVWWGHRSKRGKGMTGPGSGTHSGVGAQELRPVLYPLRGGGGGGGGHELEVGHGRAQVTRWSAGPTKGGGTIAWIGWGRVSAV